MPVYFADALVLADPAAERRQREGAPPGAPPATVTYEQLRAAPGEFRRQLERHVCAAGCVEVRGAPAGFSGPNRDDSLPPCCQLNAIAGLHCSLPGERAPCLRSKSVRALSHTIGAGRRDARGA